MVNKLPGYLIIGEARCGTTSLYNMMIQHPKITPATQKELYFFTGISKRKTSFYFERLGKCEKYQIIGEATPMYMWDYKNTLKKIKAILPNVKLIVCLRNPADKIYSHFMLGRQSQITSQKEDLKLFIKEAYKFLAKGKSEYMHFGRAKYILSLKEWFKEFPKEQFMIIKSEDLNKYPLKITNEVFSFLGLEKLWITSLHDHQLDYLPMPIEFRKKLKAFYEPYNQELYKLLGRDFNWENE